MCLDEISNYFYISINLKSSIFCQNWKIKKFLITVSRAFWDFFEHPRVTSKFIGIFEKFVCNTCTLLKKDTLAKLDRQALRCTLPQLCQT